MSEQVRMKFYYMQDLEDAVEKVWGTKTPLPGLNRLPEETLRALVTTFNELQSKLLLKG